MKKQQFLKSCLCLLLLTSTLFTFFACTSKDPLFERAENENFIAPDGTEYTFLAGEWEGYYFSGETVFQGRVKGESKTLDHLDLDLPTGFFAAKGDEDKDVLLRRSPNNEWCSIYRKASLPAFDISADNCARLELVLGNNADTYGQKEAHAACGEGVTDRAEIAEILSEIRAQKSPKDAGLYELIRKPDGFLENCYVCGVVFGFFEEEPGVVLIMQVTSFNDLAYSITVDGKEYVLPEKVLQKLQGE